MKPVRLRQMEQYIVERDFVSLDELCEHFHVSKNTVRTDVNELAERGIVEKKYGGVEALALNKKLSSFSERQVKNIDSKNRIGKCAAALLNEGDIIYIDSGTTTACLFAQGIELPAGITVITNNLMVVEQYEKYPNIDFIMLPGKLNPKTKSFSSLETLETMRKYNISKSFLAVTGISAAGGLSNSTPLEAKVKEIAVKASETVILMADASKADKPAMINFANLDDVDVWVTDEATDELVRLCTEHNVELREA
ncbi:MAG: DeoR/GlpR transcriptional regulator [Lachnospiraceae bacterium]|nr:DeoR/GlpR transcriptional regulator [Lachnospiraceae bacterium]